MKTATSIGIRRVLCGALAVALASCGGDGLDVNNVSSEGSVGGIVIDAQTRLPIEGVEVRVIAGGTTEDPVMTGADGSFSFNNVDAGEVLVTFTMAGYHTAYVRGDLPMNAGEFPAGNSTLTLGPIGLVSSAGSFAIRVIDPRGVPATNYSLTARLPVQYTDSSSGSAMGQGEIVFTVTTDTNGYATLAGFPDLFALGSFVSDTLTLLLPAYDTNGDMINEFAGGVQQLSIRSLRDPTPDVILDDAYNTTLSIRASNISQLAGGSGTNPSATVLPINETIHVNFNLPIQNNATISITDENGAAIVQAPAISIVDDNLAIAFGSDPLLPGQEYNIHIHAVAAVGDRLISNDFTASFFTRSLSGDVTVASITRDGSQVVTIEFSEPIGVFGSSQVNLSGGNCVLFFNADLGGTAIIGDFPGELTNPACSTQFLSIEPEPVGPVGKSGYTKFWRFTAPNGSDTNPLPANIRLHIIWSHVANSSLIVERADGSPVPDFTDTNSIPIP